MQNSEKNKTIAKNTIYLYIRLLVSLLLNLYMSRLLLAALGIDDFGTYNIVGGVVFLMMFVNSTMQNASLRFINISIGKGDNNVIMRTISSSIQIHILLSLLFLIVGETVGLWYVINELNVPQESYDTVLILYQLTLFTAIISIIQVPLIATVMSYEKMDAYAFVEIFHVLLRCGIIFLLVFFENKLLFYGILLFFVGLFIFLLYLFYCKRNFSTFCLTRSFKSKEIRSMLSFAIYNLIGDGTFAVRQQGTNLLINKFFGVGLNAASGVATQAASLISTFTGNTQSAFKPQIIKEYSAGDINRVKDLMKKETEIMFILLSIILNVTLINIGYLMKIWLGNVPNYAVEFCRIIMICNTLTVLMQIMSTPIHATGKVKLYNVIVGILNISCVILAYVFLKSGMDSVYAYYAYLIIIFIKIASEAYILNKNIPQISFRDLLYMIAKPTLLFLTSFAITYFIVYEIDSPIQKLITSSVVNIFVVMIFSVLMYPYVKTYTTSFISKIIR